MGLCGSLIPISYGFVLQFGSHLFWICGSLVRIRYCVVWQFGPHFLPLVGLCGSLVRISYGVVWQLGSHLLRICVALSFPSLMVMCSSLLSSEDQIATQHLKSCEPHCHKPMRDANQYATQTHNRSEPSYQTAAWFASLLVLCGSLVRISYGVVWQFGPPCLPLIGLCGSMVPISYGHV